jgi:preprotein translocase subunit SecG
MMKGDKLDSSGSGLGLMAGYCGKSNKLSGSITSGKFLNQLTVHLFLKKDFASWN